MVWKSAVLTHPLTDVSLGRELFSFPPPRITSSSAIPGVNADTSRSGGNEALVEERGIAVASQMERKVLVRVKDGRGNRMINCFARDWTTGELFVGVYILLSLLYFMYVLCTLANVDGTVGAEETRGDELL